MLDGRQDFGKGAKIMIPVLYITYNRLDYTKKTLPPLIESMGNYGKLYIVDNCSTDGTIEYLKGFEDNKKIVSIIYNSENRGIAGAMNQFFEIVKGNYELFGKVDNDTIVPENWLRDLSLIMDHENIDFVQAKHHFISSDYRDWDDLVSKCQSRTVFDNNMIFCKPIGGSGIVGRLSKVNKLDEELGKLMGWSQYQNENDMLITAFYDGVFIDILDIDDYNILSDDGIEYHIETGRIDISNLPKTSILIPVIREDRVRDCIQGIKDNAIVPEDKYEILTLVDKDREGCPKTLKKLVEMSSHNFVMFLGDDTIPERGFLVRAYKHMGNLPGGWGLVGLNDGRTNGDIYATHWLASKALLNYLEDNEFFHTGYKHTHCDMELTDKAKAMGKYIWAKDARIRHNHPFVDAKYVDDDYRKVYSDEVTRHDIKLYINRKKRDGYFKLGIGFPLTDLTVYSSFMVSWTLMEKPAYTLLMPVAPGTLEVIRNNLVIQALREYCTHLLMMDTDQTYPIDVIQKLLSHEKDVVAVNVHRRYPPFDPILYRGELGNYHHVPDDECFSGKLIEIDATGCGCILYNTDVFLDIPHPWFEVYRMSDGRVVGEDIDFCSKIKDAGYKIFADTSIKVGHISTMEITRSFYELYKKVKGLEWRPPPEPANPSNL